MITTTRMDPDGEKNTALSENENDTDCFLQGYVTNVGDVLPAFWLRRLIQAYNGPVGFVLGCRYSFLFNFRIFLVVLYITYEILK
jgi:hypothetical protein